MPQCTRVAFGVAMLVAVLTAPAPAVAAAPDGSGPWMDTVTSFRQGLAVGGRAVSASRSLVAGALGAADTSADGPTFLSLGFGGSVTLRSDALICNGPGADVRIIEVTLGLSATSERAAIDVSIDGSTWVRVAASLERSGDVGLPPDLRAVRFVRVTDVTPLTELTRLGADGYDLDGVAALQPQAACAGSGTTTTTAASVSPPPVATTGSTTPAAAQLLACSAQRLLIEDVARTGDRLRVVGIADPALVGQRVALRTTTGGPALGSALLAADGTFALTTRATTLTSSTRVVASVGAVRARPVRVSRRLLTRSVSARSSGITWTGRLAGRLPAGGATVTLSRRVGCDHFEPVASARTRPSGAFTLVAAGLAEGAGVYRVTSRVPAAGPGAGLITAFSSARGLTFEP